MQKKYDVLGVVGEGAYGIVYKCRNKETGKYVAIKKFKEIEDKLVQKTMKRELKMLQLLKHDNVVDFQEAFIYKKNLFLVFEYVEKTLLEVLEKSPEGLNPKLIRSFVFQMCKAVHYLHLNNIIHRDVKPENLLIDENMKLKLCDFGFARKITLNNNNNINAMTDYVATRWYRSPELLLSKGIYGPEVDYWAIGCIMGELADGNPMFPGENEVDQLDCIIKVLGNLPQDLVNMFYDNPLYNGKELLKVNRPESLERRYMGKLGPTAIDFLKGLLQLDPNKRINDETVFKHKYFTCFMKEPENQYILDLYEKRNNAHNNINNNNTIKINIKKEESNNDIDSNKNMIQTKVINNTTNINIINYNNYHHNGNNKNNNDIENENDSSTKRTKDQKLEINCSKKSIDDSKNIDNNTKSNPNILEDNSINTKKSLSVNKANKKYGNMALYNNLNNVKLISFSHGKTNQKYNNFQNNNISHNTLNSNLNVIENNIKNLNNNYNSNNNDIIAFANTNIDGYKTFFNINKSKDKYNFKINQGYIKEEGKKYTNKNINANNNVIDENEEYSDVSQKKKNVSKEHKKNGQLLNKYMDKYNYNNYNNFNNINNKNGGYGTFYKYNMKNSNFGGFNKKKNTSQLPQLMKINNNGNVSNHKNKYNNKNKFKYY